MSEFNEPWKLHDRGNEVVMANGDQYHPEFFTPEHLNRIIACVNACAGIPTAELARCSFHEPMRLALLAKAASFVHELQSKE